MTTSQAGDSVALSLFERHVKQALRLFDQPDRLGLDSPLASPYVLGRALRDLPSPITAQARGEVLRATVRAAAKRLWGGLLPATRQEMLDAITEVRRNPDDPRYAYVVLELRCFNDYISLHRTSDIWEQPHLLPGSKSQHYRDFDATVKRVAAVLLDELRPSVRPERPHPPETLYGYERSLAQLAEALAQNRSITLGGPGGVGKTSVAATVIGRMSNRPAFWYTVRPGFNDGVGSLLFALAAFMHEQGAANLWQYLAAANGLVSDLNLAAGLLRQDLASLSARPPILCIDDLEHLTAAGLEPVATAHAQLMELIEGLRGSAALLMISQRPLPAGDLHLELGGLDVAEVALLWHDSGLPISQQQAGQLHAYTGGNPRLLLLLLALHRSGDEALGELDSGEAIRSLLPAFQRLWRRLTAEERRALQRLSVYRGYAPEDILPNAVRDSLAQLHLIERDGAGGVALLPALAPIIREDLTSDQREALHGEAAIVRLERGEHTPAAYHFAQGGQEGRAVQVWFPQMAQAMARGEADVARPIFSGIPRQRLDKAERKALDLISTTLRQYAGEHEAGLRELEQADWSDQSESTARLWMLRGELEDALGYPERALASYGEGVRVTARLLGQLTALHQRSGLLYNRRRDLKSSWREVERAEFELEVLRGLLRDEEGRYDDALEAFHRARGLADQLGDDALRAQAERWLATVCGRRELLAEAITHATNAVTIYERVGDRLNLEKMRSNLASIYVQNYQYQSALDVGVPAYAFFMAVRDPYYASATAANLAEASRDLGDLDMARRYANEVIELGQRFSLPYARFTLGQIEQEKKNLVAAAAHFSASMQSAEQNDDTYMAAYAQRALGQALLAGADLAAGRSHILSALDIFRRMEIPSEILITEGLLAEIEAG
jgi:tetratricopeptide (TPR) repeat protein